VTELPATLEELDAAEGISEIEGSMIIKRRIWVGRGEVSDFGVEGEAAGRWVTYSERIAADDLGYAADPPALEGIEEPVDELNEQTAASTEKAVSPLRPDHLGLSYRPHVVPFGRTVGQNLEDARVGRLKDRRIQAWYEPEDRWVFRDIRYPWSTVGRIRGAAKGPYPGSGGTGVLVGPRHVLTASHVAWYPDGTPNNMRFHPAYFDESSPFGSARVVAIRYYTPKVVGAISESNEWNDFVVLILDWRIGDVCGWMGGRAFSRSWSGLTVWSCIGYPGMFKRTSHVPTFQREFSVTLPAEYDEHRAIVEHFADCTDGNSGGPIFAYWDFEGRLMPYVVGIHSAGPYGEEPYPMHPNFDNQAAAGQRQVNLVLNSRAVHP